MQAEAARLAAARREALEALIGDLRPAQMPTRRRLDRGRGRAFADAAAQALLRPAGEIGAELDAATLELEAARKKSEETLTFGRRRGREKRSGAQNRMQDWPRPRVRPGCWRWRNKSCRNRGAFDRGSASGPPAEPAGSRS